MKTTDISSKRLLSLDFMRGLIMVLLMLESTNLFDRLQEIVRGGFFEGLVVQLSHHPWHGLRFWDLIQPGFMFIAGTALSYSLYRQNKAGITWNNSFFKVLKRSGWLFFLGVLDYAVHPDGLSFELWDVLTQLSFTTLVAFLIYRFPLWQQIVIGCAILLLAEFLYRFTNIRGFDQPFTDQHNFGNYVDLLLMKKTNAGGWVAINCLSTSLHTIAGSVAGKLLLSDAGSRKKIKTLLVAGGICLILGYGMDYTCVTPIIKRIATTSFVFASGGWCLIAFGFLYWWIDVKNHRRYLIFFTLVGMNSIFIYLFFEIVGKRWFNGYIDAITFGSLSPLYFSLPVQGIISSLAIFVLEWLMCRFLYKRGVFIKI